MHGGQLIERKVGSIVVPRTGTILALVSSPSYNLSLLTEKNASNPLSLYNEINLLLFSISTIRKLNTCK